MIERDPEINKREKKSYIGVTVYPIEGEGRGRNEIAKRAKAFETLLCLSFSQSSSIFSTSMSSFDPDPIPPYYSAKNIDDNLITPR